MHFGFKHGRVCSTIGIITAESIKEGRLAHLFHKINFD